MRRLVLRLDSLAASTLLAGLMLTAGCSGGAVPIDKALAGEAATVNGQPLTGAKLEEWMLKWQTQPDRGVANLLLSTWINTTLLVDALRHQGMLDDSALVDRVIEPDAERGVTLQFFVARNQKRPPVTDAEADSLADVDNVRVFQQIVLRIPPKADSATQVAIGSRAQALLKRAQGGADFTALVKEASQDSATRAQNGYLPAISHQQVSGLPRSVQQIWTLRPGDISQLLLLPPDIRLFRRASRAESRPYLKAWLTPLLAGRSDSLYVDSVARAQHVVIAADARPRMRVLATEPVISRDTAPFAMWKGGELTPAMVRTAVLQIQPDQRAQLANASDSAITSLLTQIARRQVVLQAITTAPMPTAEARKALAPEYRNALAIMRAQLGGLAPDKTPGAAADIYMDSVIARTRRHVPLPGVLAEVLRDRARISVDSMVMLSVLRDAVPKWRIQHAKDSINAVTGPDSGVPGLTPGGAPPQ